jgi:hypothetical protein
MSMYAYRPRRGVKTEDHSQQRYFSSFDRFMVMLGAAAVLAFVVDGVATHGSSVVESFQHLFGIAH